MSMLAASDTCTLPKILRRNARVWAEQPAIREKDRGIWQTWTWRVYHEHVRAFALGLAALGFQRGHKLTDHAIDKLHSLKLVLRHPARTMPYPVHVREMDKKKVRQASLDHLDGPGFNL